MAADGYGIVSGTTEFYTTSSDASGETPPTGDVVVRHRSTTSQFLENKGFGWLMETNDGDDGDQPLL